MPRMSSLTTFEPLAGTGHVAELRCLSDPCVVPDHPDFAKDVDTDLTSTPVAVSGCSRVTFLKRLGFVIGSSGVPTLDVME